jgi:hypothetical protein
MTLDPDVAKVAKHFGIDPALIQAVVIAEGGGIAIVKAVQCTYPKVTTKQEALEITCRSAVHAMSDYVKSHPLDRDEFVQFWAARWAPQGVTNDPTNLNKNWPVNVSRAWDRA